MKNVLSLVIALSLWLQVACSHAQVAGSGRATPPADVALRVDGADLRDDAGNIVTLRAVNLGNWFLIEPWMYGQFFLDDEKSFTDLLESRFGQGPADYLIERHRDNWMTQRDFAGIAAAGFNAVRIPFHYRLVESAPFQLDEAGVDRLLSAVDMADKAGLYVIFDMHAAPGGQSLDGPSGDSDANDLWTDEQAQERFVWIWQSLARRLKNHRNFVAYDLLNEPFGDFSTDYSQPMIDIMGRAIDAIREIDPNRLIFVPGTLQGTRFYGDPADRGWVNVGLTEHFYPGIFDGNPPTLGTMARFIAAELRDRAAHARGMGVPFLLGEFNPVFDRSGSPESARAVFDAAEDLGVHAAMWSYKLVKPDAGVGPDNWYVTTNAQPLGFSSLQTSSYIQIEDTFESLDTMPLQSDAGFVAAMTSPTPLQVLPDVAEPPLAAPATDAWPGWSAADIGAIGVTGGQMLDGIQGDGADRLTLFSSGADLFGTNDSIRLASTPYTDGTFVSGVLDAFSGGRFAQAGVTIRATDASGSPHVSLVAFPDGRVLVKSRSFGNTPTGQRYLATAGFPVGLALRKSGSTFTAWITDDEGTWQTYPLSESAVLGTSPRGGFFGAANRSGERAGPLAAFTFDDARAGAALAPPPVLDLGPNLLSNASFEQAGGSSSQATSWTYTGANFSRQTNWVPTRAGNALLAYRHWEAGSSDSTASQIVTGLTPGKSYVWTVYANRDTVGGGQALADEVDLRVETATFPLRWLESVTYDVAEIATGSDWSRLQVRFVATQESHRLRLIATPAPSGNRDGAVKFDTFVLTEEAGG